MPPRIQPSFLRTHHYNLRPIADSLTRLAINVRLHRPAQQARSASILGNLQDVPSSYNRRIRRGRGASSGKGKTSGRGHKGQKQHGKVPFKFNGGQTKDEVVKGQRGFTNNFSIEMTVLNIDRIQSWIDQGRLDTSKPITVKELHESRCTHGIKDGVKLLAKNGDTLRSPIHITVSRASSTAIAAIEAAGGSVTTRYYTRPSIRRILKGETHPVLSLLSPETAASSLGSPNTLHVKSHASSPVELRRAAGIIAHLPPMSAFKYRLPDPASRTDIEYYRDPLHRGYLSYTVAEGHGPSLFFKTPGAASASSESARKKTTGAKASAGTQSAGRIW
ncbi:hypothetical protein FH972_024359 [Carpinus fangiana]|uniref:Large ribosomal subunit protein uL15/eL18 domain-containing protein n=1 Tax=Carpinus fangiana TaxID=176857 RepID=A0A5N6KY50_9ROSI|nr:hypothetical protein FH972_024359 [Carpinus fangiana]